MPFCWRASILLIHEASPISKACAFAASKLQIYVSRATCMPCCCNKTTSRCASVRLWASHVAAGWEIGRTICLSHKILKFLTPGITQCDCSVSLCSQEISPELQWPWNLTPNLTWCDFAENPSLWMPCLCIAVQLVAAGHFFSSLWDTLPLLWLFPELPQSAALIPSRGIRVWIVMDRCLHVQTFAAHIFEI